jgi:hypothetical protein
MGAGAARSRAGVAQYGSCRKSGQLEAEKSLERRSADGALARTAYGAMNSGRGDDHAVLPRRCLEARAVVSVGGSVDDDRIDVESEAERVHGSTVPSGASRAERALG